MAEEEESNYKITKEDGTVFLEVIEFKRLM